jgi:hypothetical protein
MPRLTRWLLYVFLALALIAQRYFALRFHGVHTLLQALLWAAISILPFIIFFLIFRHDKRISSTRWILFFTLFILMYFIMDPFGSHFLSFLASNRHLARLIELVVMAGGGWLLPLLMLATFLAFILYRHKGVR